MRSPDEIKKGLECCITDNCKECPYYPLYEVFGCKLARAKDALALIQQLQAENAEKDETIQMLKDGNASLMRMIDEECVKTVTLEAERDAAVEDLEALMDSLEIGTACEFCGKDCMFSDSACSPEWRGVQKENH